jgi:hypothetical protein
MYPVRAPMCDNATGKCICSVRRELVASRVALCVIIVIGLPMSMMGVTGRRVVERKPCCINMEGGALLLV